MPIVFSYGLYSFGHVAGGFAVVSLSRTGGVEDFHNKLTTLGITISQDGDDFTVTYNGTSGSRPWRKLA